MNGGLMKTASRLALIAAAGLMGGITLSAHAADLSGDCCADLEQRVAELEATTARKGNRKVSLTVSGWVAEQIMWWDEGNRKVSLEISGQVNRALLAWDDGFDSDAYIVDNDTSSTRFRFKGSGTMKPGWTAGFLIEIELQDAASNTVNQFDDEGPSGEADGIFTRHASWYIESQRLGRITLGQTSPATDDLTLINLGGSISDAELYWNNAFFLRDEHGRFTDIQWTEIASGLDTARGDYVRYDTPSIYGFILSAAWGEDDAWDIALRYQQEWNSIRVAAGIGYAWDGDDNAGFFGNQFFDDDNFDTEKVVGSASIMHVPSGVYVSVAAGTIDFNDGRILVLDDDEDLGFRDVEDETDASFYYIQLGVTKRFMPYGATTVYAEYGRYEDFGRNVFLGAFEDDDILVDDTRIRSSEVDRYGFGVVQAFDGAALELYLQFHYYEADLTTTRSVLNELNGYYYDVTENLDVEDWYAGVVGARIKF